MAFDAKVYLASAGNGRSLLTLLRGQRCFTQGEAADAVLYLQSGRAKLTVVSGSGKEATITLLSAGEFAGEESLDSTQAKHKSTFTCMTDCLALKIERQEMIRVLHKQHGLSEVFLAYLLARATRLQTDFINQIFDSGERRLAHALLLMTKFCEPSESEDLIPEVSEETLAEMIGATKDKVGFYLKRFHELGLIEYSDRIRVHGALLNVILHDQFPDDNAARPSIAVIPQAESSQPNRNSP